ncbi:cytochrome c3 family protein [Bacteroidota bacterium]
MRIIVLVITAIILSNFSAATFAQDDDEICFDCHGDISLTTERDGKEISLFVSQKKFSRSVHSENGCVSCHYDIDPEDLPHEENLEKVDCSNCHDEASAHFESSLHGTALREGKYLAPTCESCHGKHDILFSKDENARTYIMNIPALCGSCHKEGTQVSGLRGISQRHILENYSQSIHGDGLYRRGLTVTAVCTSCHSSHDILPHENPLSTINKDNITKTCMQCHSQIERVHQKVIRGEMWEKEPHKIPVCIDCHQPHKTRRVFYDESFPDRLCMSCHDNKNLYKTIDGKRVSLYVDESEFRQSAHNTNSCIKCHTNISNSRNPVCLSSGKVDCSMCHPETQTDYDISRHGTLHASGDQNAPYCTDCHGTHNTTKKEELNSPIFARNIPELCGKCHKEGAKAAAIYTGPEHEILENYKMSIHGKGLLQSGLMVTATCVDCHTSHRELPINDPESTVNPNNIATTCGNCHLGIYEEFKSSIHSPLVTQTDKKLPVCNDCHFSHTINRVDQTNFRQGILDQCGKCHMDVTETYFDTFHGKVSKLGSVKTAKCYDCHGAHNILPTYNPESTLSRENVVETCKTCHPNSNRKFVGYLTHATHHDKDKYPFLYYTFWFMTILLIGTFSFFGLHTLLWLPRALQEKRKEKNKISGKNKDDK